MRSLSRKAVIAAIVGAGAVGGLIGAALFGPSPAGAQTTTPAPAATSGTFHSNENTTHETGESAQREADENSGKFHGGWHGGHSNEDKTHEAGENAAHEADENARQSSSTATPGATG